VVGRVLKIGAFILFFPEGNLSYKKLISLQEAH
jgi:hypothetical protein